MTLTDRWQLKQVPAWVLVLALAACGGSGTSAPINAPADSSAASGAKSWRDPVPVPPPPANMPAPDTPQFFAAAADEYAYSQGRSLDQQANPDYLAKIAPLFAGYAGQGGCCLPGDGPYFHDPYVQDWGTTQGQIEDVVINNRYGAKLTARLYAPKLPFTDPVTGEISNGPFPTIIFVPGWSKPKVDSPNPHFSYYEGSLEQIASHGYVVLAVNPQGQGGSEYFAPPSPYCDPQGDWTQPQELGLVEQGPCAGQEDPSLPPVTSTVHPLTEPGASWDETASGYELFRPRFVFPALDAAAWLSSSQNPWRALMDESRLGIVGHSAGADGATVAGNGDPHHRFSATVAWDGAGLPPDTMQATVPSLFIHSEDQASSGPYHAPPPDEHIPAYRMEQRFIADGVDSMMLALRGSEHYECGYYPYPLGLASVLGISASSKGGAVCVYYTVAWFDRWLKGANTAHVRGDESVQADDARRRLLARTFDDSTDKTAMGQGTFDPVAQKNVPYTLAGENVADHLTVFLHSQLAFDGVRCLDWQAGCGF